LSVDAPNFSADGGIRFPARVQTPEAEATLYIRLYMLNQSGGSGTLFYLFGGR